jgi:hypothetical protein
MRATQLILMGALVASIASPASARLLRVVCHDGVLTPTTRELGCDWDGSRDGVCTFAFFCQEVCSVPPAGEPTPGGQVTVQVGRRRVVKRAALPTGRVTRYILRCTLPTAAPAR